MKKVWLIGLTAVVFAFFVVPQATAATLCVEPTGAMGCFTTVQAAVDAAAPGDHIWVSPGVYYENVHVTTSTITIQGGEFTPARRRGVGGWAAVDPTRVIIDARPDPACAGDGPAIWIDGAHHVTVANLTVRHAALGGMSGVADNIHSTGNFTTLDTVHSLSADWDGAYIVGEYPTVRNSYFTANYDGIGLEYGIHALIQNNTIYNHYYEGIYAYDSWYATFSGNTINGTAGSGYEGIYLDYCDYSVVSNNTIRGTGEDGIETYDSYYLTIADNDIRSCYYAGIYVYYSFGSVVTGNSVSGSDYYGIYVDGEEDTISDNVVEDTYYPGIEVYNYDTTITGNLVRNTFDDDCYYISAEGGTISNNLADGATYGAGFDLYVDDMTVSNNTAQFSAHEGFYIYGDYNVINNNTARHNGDEWDGGFYIYGDDNTLSGNLAEMNPGYGFYIDGANTLTGNTANDNYRTGIYLASTNGGTLMVNANVATNNHGEGIANNATTTCYIVNNIALGNRTDICDDAPLAIPPDAFNGNTFATGGPGVPCCLE